MTYSQLVKHFGTEAIAARVLGLPQSTINYWARTKGGIPHWRQSFIEAVTGRQLRARVHHRFAEAPVQRRKGSDGRTLARRNSFHRPKEKCVRRWLANKLVSLARRIDPPNKEFMRFMIDRMVDLTIQGRAGFKVTAIDPREMYDEADERETLQ